jgi:hypothetical protein
MENDNTTKHQHSTWEPNSESEYSNTPHDKKEEHNEDPLSPNFKKRQSLKENQGFFCPMNKNHTL